ncbi:MAG: glycosyltransferase family 2 protein, partial [Acidimicrobiia bacterium]
PLVALMGAGLWAAVVAIPGGSRIMTAIGLTVALIGALSLHGLDVARQDRLRTQIAPGTKTSMTPSPSAANQRKPPPRDWQPIVTVVVTTHNEDDLLLQCLQSVADQTWSDLECVVVDDLSTDFTLGHAAAAFADDERFRFIHSERNLGLAGSRNRGLTQARGIWVTFLDADDFLYTDAVAERMRRIAEERDDAWVVGAYCSWHSVPEKATPLDPAPPIPAPHDNVTWLDATFGAPFIASAPLVRRDVLEALGGFNNSLETAEDFELWSRLLRQGYAVLWAPVVGIAYRQRRASMYRRAPAAHATITSRVYDVNQTSVHPGTVQVGPFLFVEPAHVHQADLAKAERLLTGYVAAVGADDQVGASELWGLLSNVAQPWMRWALRPSLIEHTARRVEFHDPDGAEARAARVIHDVRRAIATLWDEQPGGKRPELPEVDVDPPGPYLELSAPRILKGPVVGNGERPGLLMPSAAYHCDELGPLAKELDSRGVSVKFVVIPKRLSAVREELRKYDYPVHVVDPETEDIERFSASASFLVTLNDWGDYDRFVLAANDHGVPTFGKVEGVQDFEDADVHWTRRAYQQVSHVLCQGPNDYLNTRGNRSIVGSTRLERIWKQAPTPPGDRVVVINFNFTYGVLSEFADMWLDTVITACKRIGLDYLISAHPAQKPPTSTRVSSKPMRYLLTQPSILVSRFSTVPFEAMARGVPFVYHNPHDEKVPTFHSPGGAFPITTSTKELEDQLLRMSSVLDYRAVCAPFFLAQVDVDESSPAEERTAAVVIS